jgi:hypothetical protein
MWSWLALNLPVCALAQSLPATAFLQRLPLVPAQHICTDEDAPRIAFQSRQDAADFAERLRAKGRALVQADPACFDPKLPRMALQRVVFRTGIGLLDPLKSNDCGEINPGFKALWQTVHTTPCNRIQRLLAP